MFLLMRQNEPIGVFDKIQTICKQIEERIIKDYLLFERLPMYQNEPFDLTPYMDLRIIIIEKNAIGWVIPDVIFNELTVYDVLNTENSGVLKRIEEYNESMILS